MRRLLVVAATILVLGVGCRHSTDVSVNTPQGNVTVQQDPGSSTTTVKSTEGNTTVTTQGNTMTGVTTDKNGKTSSMSIGKNFDLAELGVKTYPGSTLKEGSSIKSDAPDGQSLQVQLETKDPASKIIDFYKGEVKADNFMLTQDGGMVSGTAPSGDKVVVLVSKVDNGNNISMTVVKKKK